MSDQISFPCFRSKNNIFLLQNAVFPLTFCLSCEFSIDRQSGWNVWKANKPIVGKKFNFGSQLKLYNYHESEQNAGTLNDVESWKRSKWWIQSKDDHFLQLNGAFNEKAVYFFYSIFFLTLSLLCVHYSCGILFLWFSVLLSFFSEERFSLMFQFLH